MSHDNVNLLQPAAVYTRIGSIARFSVTRVFNDEDAPVFDAEIVLADGWIPSAITTTVRFLGIRDLKFGDADGIDLGSRLYLSIMDVSSDGWEGIRFRVVNLEQDCLFSLYCRNFEILSS